MTSYTVYVVDTYPSAADAASTSVGRQPNKSPEIEQKQLLNEQQKRKR